LGQCDTAQRRDRRAVAPVNGPLLTPLRPRGSNQLGMRQFNERVVIQSIRVNGMLPKAELARVTGLTAQTVGLITSRLEEDGLILRQDRVRGRIGQPSVPLALNPNGAFSIGIKIGRRSADFMVVDFVGAVRHRQAIQYAFPEVGTILLAIDEKIKSLSTELGASAEKLVGVGVAAPFQMGGWHRLLGLSAAQSEAWNRIDLSAAVQALTDLPVSFAKDTSAACVAELLQGRGRDLKSFLYLFVDTFVGGGLVLNSHLHGGARGNAGAVASLPLSLTTGSVAPEQLIGAASLWELEQRFVALGLDPSAVYDDRALQQPWLQDTQAWIQVAARALAFAAVSGTALVDVDAIVLDGSMSRELLSSLLQATRKAMQDYSWEGLWAPELHAGTIGSDARALGGALLPLHANFAPDHDVFLKAAQ
jgi:predicted NBD/HSP70 family sugar kinase